MIFVKVKYRTDSENIVGVLEMLQPWAALETPVEELSQLETATALSGLLASQNFEQIEERGLSILN